MKSEEDLGTPLMRLKEAVVNQYIHHPQHWDDLVDVMAFVDLATKWAAAREDLLSTVGVDAEKLNAVNLAAADLSLGLIALTAGAPSPTSPLPNALD